MAQIQCPNCGGFKTYSWFSTYLWGIINVLPVAFVSLFVIAIFPPAILAWFIYGGYKVWEYVCARPPHTHYCELCQYNFDPIPNAPLIAGDPGLQALGNDLLARQAAAAAEAEQAQWEEDQRNYYGR